MLVAAHSIRSWTDWAENIPVEDTTVDKADTDSSLDGEGSHLDQVQCDWISPGSRFACGYRLRVFVQETKAEVEKDKDKRFD